MDENPYKSPEQANCLREPADGHPPRRDLSPLAAKYLHWLGILNLVSLNLGGLLWLWFATKIKRHNPKFRLATLILCGLMAFSGVAMIVFAFFGGTEGTSILFHGNSILDNPPRWLVGVFGVVVMLAHGFPCVLLLDPATKFHFARPPS